MSSRLRLKPQSYFYHLRPQDVSFRPKEGVSKSAMTRVGRGATKPFPSNELLGNGWSKDGRERILKGSSLRKIIANKKRL